MPAIQDVELSDVRGDRFGHSDHEKSLRNLVENQDFKAPYSIGLLGGWGSGKSSIKKFYTSELEERRSDIHCISFNAWRFGGEDIRRALLRYILLALGGTEREVDDEVYNHLHHMFPVSRSKREIFKDYIPLLARVGSIVLIVLVVAVVIWAITRTFGEVNTTLFSIVAVALSLVVSPALYAVVRLPLHSSVTRIELPKTSIEQYERLVMKHLEKFSSGKSTVKGKKSDKYKKVLIFVDDLDRLSAEEMVDGLDAIRGFMELQGEAERSPDIVFVISCDEEKVADALESRRRKQSSEMPGAISSREDARRYLDRIFQFRLEIPPLPKLDMRDYTRKRLENDMEWLAERLKQKDQSLLNQVVDDMIHPGVQSPRTAVHMLNAFGRGWWLAHIREIRTGTSAAGGLKEGAVTEYSRLLAAMSAIQVDFPEFYDDLKQTPELLEGFIRVFIDGNEVDQEGETLRIALEKYALTSNSPDVSQEEVALKSKYRALQTYLSSVRTLDRPVDLRPILYLSQNALERQQQSSSPTLITYLMQGDANGILNELGTSSTGPDLTENGVGLLKTAVEDVRGESEANKERIGLALAKISGKLPRPRASEILSDLNAFLVASRRLRSLVGVERMAELLPRLRRNERRRLASELVNDLLPAEEEVRLETPAPGTPNPEDVRRMISIAIPAILKVRGSSGLTPAAEQLLLRWLSSLRVTIGGQTVEHYFDDMDPWLADAEDPDAGDEDIVLSMGNEYLEYVVGFAHETFSSILDEEGILRRARRVLEHLLSRGGEDRDKAWEQLRLLVRSPEPAIHRLAWSIAEDHKAEASPETLDPFLEAFGDILMRLRTSR
jgi:hypothetical protein